MLHFALSGFGAVGAIPSILARLFVGITGSGKVITTGKSKREPPNDILLFVFHRRGIGM